MSSEVRETNWLLVEVIAAPLVGSIPAVAQYLLGPTQRDIENSIAIWIITTVLSALAIEVLGRLKYRIAEFQKKQNDILEAVQRAYSQNNQRFLEWVLKYSDQDISKDDMPLVWFDLVHSARKNYKATNKINARNLHTQPFGKLVFQAQKLKTERHSTFGISKIFIHQNTIDTEMQTVMRAQAEHFSIKSVLGQDVEQICNRKGNNPSANKLHQDFGIFDDEIVLLWFVDEKADFTGGRLIFNQAEVQQYGKFFDALDNKAKKYS